VVRRARGDVPWADFNLSVEETMDQTRKLAGLSGLLLLLVAALPAHAAGPARIHFGTGHASDGTATHLTTRFHLGQTIYWSATTSTHLGAAVLHLIAPDKVSTANFKISGLIGNRYSGDIRFTSRQPSGTYTAQVRAGSSILAAGTFTWRNTT
jgi:hypothetical protein